jgi:hypothetical protein
VKRILWGINVYTRLNHLRLQQALIRDHFGGDRAVREVDRSARPQVDLLVFSNHERNRADVLHFMEDRLHIHPTNSGGHTGCQDAYNEGLRYLQPEHEFVIWSHADCLLNDYSYIEETLEKMRSENAVFACLEGVTQRSNPRSPTWGDHGPYALNDLMVFRSDFYRRVFPRHELLDGFDENGQIRPRGVEVAMGYWVTESLAEGETVHAMGTTVSHHQSATNLGAIGATACMSNDFDKSVAFVRSKIDDETVEWLDGLGILARKFDDVRQGHD